jgi:pimeloyl-ACP methyl ester carboxylesterase
VTPLRRYLLRTDAAGDVLGLWNFDDYMATEELWPTADVGDDFRTEVQNTTPVLFVQGDWDPNTPMENLVQVTPHFVNGRTLIVHQGEHGAYARVRRTLPGATAAIMEFVRSGSTVNLPSAVTVPAREFRAPTFPAPKR